MKALKIMSLLKNERGFSLTEIMIGGGILAGVALASAQMFKDQNLAQKKLSDEQKLTIFHQGLVKQISNPANCNATMKANGVVGQPLAAGKTFDRVARCKNNCVEKPDDTDPNNPVTDFRAVHVEEDIEANDILGKDKPIDNTRVWSVDEIRFASSNALDSTGPAVIKVTYEKDPRLTQGATRKITKDVIVNLRFDEAGNFQECLSPQESTVNNLQNDFCKTLNYGNFDSTGTGAGAGSGRVATWNEQTQQCEITLAKNCSGPGLVVDGIDSTGKVKCKKIVSEHIAPLMQQPSSTSTQSCSPTQKAVLAVHSTGALRIVCQ